MSPLTTMEHYPPAALSQLKQIEALILKTAKQRELGPISCSKKWSQSSYQGPYGTPIRLGWEAKAPDVCFIYFHCQTKVVASLREVFGSNLKFIGNRAIELPLEQPLPTEVLVHCIQTALNYTRLKHLPLLGL